MTKQPNLSMGIVHFSANLEVKINFNGSKKFSFYVLSKEYLLSKNGRFNRKKKKIQNLIFGNFSKTYILTKTYPKLKNKCTLKRLNKTTFLELLKLIFNLN